MRAGVRSKATRQEPITTHDGSWEETGETNTLYHCVIKNNPLIA